MTSQEAQPQGPLAGIRVVEIGTLVAAPFAARMLADFGADVIKIEPPDGDPLRGWRKLHNGTSLWWSLQGRNKRSVRIDLKSEAGRDVARRLIDDADILIENLRPGGLEKLGLAPDDLTDRNPNLIVARISGYGQTGPYRDRPGFGAVGEAMGGVRYTTGSADAEPARTGISLGDSLASLHAVIGALMALLQVKTGKGAGQVVDVSLFESVFNLMESIVPEYDMFGEVRGRSGGRLPGICPSNTYLTADGHWVVIAGNGDRIFRRLMTAIGRDDLAADPRLADNAGRVAHEELVDGAIAEWTAGLDLDAVMAALEAAEVPGGRIYSAADIVSDAHYRARDMIQETELHDGARVLMPGIVPKLSASPGAVRWSGQPLGADTRSVLIELGFDGSEVERLAAEGVI